MECLEQATVQINSPTYSEASTGDLKAFLTSQTNIDSDREDIGVAESTLICFGSLNKHAEHCFDDLQDSDTAKYCRIKFRFSK